jgi:S1-C subfamily serine protease
VVTGVTQTGAAAAAGIRKGDVITGINGVVTTSIPQMTEQIARYKPGDKISISYTRDEKQYNTNTVLKNVDGNTDIVKSTVLDGLGADLVTLDKADAAKLGIRGGVYVDNISSGILKKQTNMKRSFIILKAAGQPVNSVEELRKVLEKQKKVQVEGVYPELNGVYYYNIDLANGEEF